MPGSEVLAHRDGRLTVFALLVVVFLEAGDRLTDPEQDEQEEENEGQAVVSEEPLHGSCPLRCPSRWAGDAAILDRSWPSNSRTIHVDQDFCRASGRSIRRT